MITTAIEHDVAVISGVFALFAAVVAAGGMLLARWLDRRHDERIKAFDRTNTEQHLENKQMLDFLVTKVSDFSGHMYDVKSDVRDVKSDVRELRSRIGGLEDREVERHHQL